MKNRKIFTALLYMLICCTIFTACTHNAGTASSETETPSDTSSDVASETSSDISSGTSSETSTGTSSEITSETSSVSETADSSDADDPQAEAETDTVFESAYDLYYETVTYHEHGLLVCPEGGYAKTMTTEEIAEMLGAETVNLLDAVSFPLELSSGERSVLFYGDDTVFYGAELLYTDDEQDTTVTVAFNPDHQVVRGGYYVGTGLDVDFMASVGSSVVLTVSETNEIEGHAVALGITTAYQTSGDASGLTAIPVLIASFTCSDMNYVIEGRCISETDFLRIVYAVLTA